MSDKLKSRKLWVTIISAAALVAGQGFGLDQNLVSAIAKIAMVYILGQGAVDTAAALKNGGK